MQVPPEQVSRTGLEVLLAAENRRIGKAMLDYGMLADGDRVLVAVSGGTDSQVLLWLLAHWRGKAPIRYHLHGVHVDMEGDATRPGHAARHVLDFIRCLNVGGDILPAAWKPSARPSNTPSFGKDICHFCASSRRRQLFDFARQHHFNCIALGHHRDDIVETFLLNLLYSGNISTMRPKQDLFAGRLSLIRPLAYLAKNEVSRIAEVLDLKEKSGTCPLSGNTRRQTIREILALLEEKIPDGRKRIFSSLGHVRTAYLLQQEPQ